MRELNNQKVSVNSDGYVNLMDIWKACGSPPRNHPTAWSWEARPMMLMGKIQDTFIKNKQNSPVYKNVGGKLFTHPVLVEEYCNTISPVAAAWYKGFSND